MTMPLDSLRTALEEERNRLLSFIEALPESQKIKHIDGLLALYFNEEKRLSVQKNEQFRSPESSVKPRFGYGEKTKAVESAAVSFLTQRGFRATSSDFLPYMSEVGIELGGKNPNSTLASFLSTSKRFNNLKGYGYGLVEWGDSVGPKADSNSASVLR